MRRRCRLSIFGARRRPARIVHDFVHATFDEASKLMPYTASSVADTLIDLLLLPLSRVGAVCDRSGPAVAASAGSGLHREHLRETRAFACSQAAAALGLLSRSGSRKCSRNEGLSPADAAPPGHCDRKPRQRREAAAAADRLAYRRRCCGVWHQLRSFVEGWDGQSHARSGRRRRAPKFESRHLRRMEPRSCSSSVGTMTTSCRVSAG